MKDECQDSHVTLVQSSYSIVAYRQLLAEVLCEWLVDWFRLEHHVIALAAPTWQLNPSLHCLHISLVLTQKSANLVFPTQRLDLSWQLDLSWTRRAA